MIQLYLLSILCNGIAGYLLFCEDDEKIEKLQIPINTPTFHLVLGILSSVTGILKLLSPIANSGRGIIIFGDLIPAAAGIIAGLVLIFGIYRKDVSHASGELDRIGANLLTVRKPLGIGLMAAALAHFIFGEILFL
jgi:hypothetical protein